MNTEGRKKPPVRSEPQDLDGNKIRLRAYQLYEARGRGDGHELDDWLCAEEEFTWKKVRTVSAASFSSTFVQQISHAHQVRGRGP